MESNKSQIWKSTMNSGAILGLGLIIHSVLLYVFDLSMVSGFTYISYLIILGGIIYGTKIYRDNILGGSISYSHALGTGVLITLFGGIISGFYQLIFVTYIDPEYFNRMMETVIEQYQNAGFDDEQIEQMIEISNYTRKPFYFLIMTILGSAIMGFIFSLLTSIFLKKENDVFADAMQDIE